jgi:phosphoribosyl-AMP cyclohydrolase / phosphoribosyl-ATP pyrophosphohydrolase
MDLKPNFEKNPDGLLPVIIQDAQSHKVLMLGYMNKEAFQKTLNEGRVIFYSRSKQRLWMKGETSGHFLDLKEVKVDCDGDALLIKAKPNGPVCHTGNDTCFEEENKMYSFLPILEQIINDRFTNPTESSYVAGLFAKGINKIAQKVGEEAVELVIESKDNNSELFLNEAADLLFHLLILLKAKGHSLNEVENVLSKRMK